MRRARLPLIVGFVVLIAFAAQAGGQVPRPPKRVDGKLSSELTRLVDATSVASRSQLFGRLVHDRNRVAVTIRLREDATSIDARLTLAGAAIANRLSETIEAYVPIWSLREVAALPEVLRIDAIVRPEPLVTSQGVSVHNAALWHANNHTGSGIRIGIIDIGFTGYGTLIGRELPAPAAVRCYTAVGAFSADLADCASDPHGTAVAESLVDVAPDVTLYISNPLSPLDLRQTVEWMGSQGVKVINHSVGWSWDGPGDGTSPFAWSPQSTVDFATSAGILMVVSAGNHQTATWTGGYVDGNSNLWHDFATADEINNVTLSAGESLRVQARWDDVWGGATRDLDLYVVDTSGSILSWSIDPQIGSPSHIPFEFVTFTAPYSGSFGIAVSHYAGARPAWLQVQTFSQQPLEHRVAGYSIGNPAESANPGLLAVGAAHWNTTGTIAFYSSLGPTLDQRVKPDIVGVTSGDTVTYGPGGFGGTSQASPHVAGLAALVLQANPSFTPVQLAAYLKNAALPRGPVPNNSFGYGLAYLGTSPCHVTLASSGRYFFSTGGTSSTPLSIGGVCPWNASVSDSWISVTAPSGTGPATLTFTVAPNPTNARRMGTISVGEQVYTVRQAGRPVVTSPDDLNGDDRMDVLLQHTNGALAVWFMDDTFLIDGAMLNTARVDPAWKIVGTADANADGKADIYWQHDAGYLAVWYMDGVDLVDSVQLNPDRAPEGWRVRTVADFSGDGEPDLILQHADGRLAAWYMNQLDIVEGVYLTPARLDPAWHVVGSGDIDQDAQLDLFLQNQVDGSLAAWFMAGPVLVEGAYLSPVRVADQRWRVRGVGDLNGDGTPDLLWQHSTTGNLAGWILEGTTLLDGAIFDPPSLGDPGWRIAAPR